MKYFSMFTGIGGFDIALNRAGHECVGMSEIDKYASMILKYRFKGVKNYGDATKINADELPDFDLLCGGFPCQSFSIAGKRKGFGDTRGTLFFEVAKIAKIKRPKYLFLENVKGLLNHDKGETFRVILQTLDELGYNVEWQVLNSKNYGVPQNRERVFIIGHLRESSSRQIFPLGQNDKKTNDIQKQQNIANTLTRRHYQSQASGTYVIKRELNAQKIIQLNNPNHSMYRIYDSHGLCPTLNTMQGGNTQPFITVPEATNPDSTTRRGRVGKNIAQTLNTSMQQHTIIPVIAPERLNKHQNGRIFKTDGEPMFTLTGQDKHGVYDGFRIRILTPKECERLQGFPDDWTKIEVKQTSKQKNIIGIKKYMSNHQRYKMCGNAVTVNVIEEIIKNLK